jgi:ribosomal protein L40E
MINLLPNQAIECEKCGHLTFDPQWIVSVCIHCKIPLNEHTMADDNDAMHMFLCKKCAGTAKLREDEFHMWERNFYHKENTQR